ncbi:hypothetical protein BDZ94DRAFT_1312888 [Collybia nuda]|uniref:DUF6534 domain-containing protein n=1 Tax=Collybia nuda TaxID=64659 RepID=A0A9P5XYD5_9AGAR|nr:hypothetical protein BDZ94DRAFT_1312888 [Collybia nuda]
MSEAVFITGLTPFLIGAPTYLSFCHMPILHRGYLIVERYNCPDLCLLSYISQRQTPTQVFGGTLILSTAQLSIITYMVYFWMIVGRTPPNYALHGVIKQSLVFVQAYITYSLSTIVQCFYAMRVWFVSEKQVPLVAVIVVLSFSQLGGGFALISHAIIVNSLSDVYSRFSRVSGIIELGSSILCDITITASLVIYLRKNRNQSNTFRNTKLALDRLVLYSINIGLLTNIVALTNLVTWLALPESNFTWAVFHSILGTVYINSMLVSYSDLPSFLRLNARQKIRQDLGAGGNSFSISRFDIDATTAPHDVEMVGLLAALDAASVGLLTKAVHHYMILEFPISSPAVKVPQKSFAVDNGLAVLMIFIVQLYIFTLCLYQVHIVKSGFRSYAQMFRPYNFVAAAFIGVISTAAFVLGILMAVKMASLGDFDHMARGAMKSITASCQGLTSLASLVICYVLYLGRKSRKNIPSTKSLYTMPYDFLIDIIWEGGVASVIVQLAYFVIFMASPSERFWIPFELCARRVLILSLLTLYINHGTPQGQGEPGNSLVFPGSVKATPGTQNNTIITMTTDISSLSGRTSSSGIVATTETGNSDIIRIQISKTVEQDEPLVESRKGMYSTPTEG